nr:transmembrane protein 171 [Zonotrichia albicollis]
MALDLLLDKAKAISGRTSRGSCSPASPRSRGYFRVTLDFGHVNPTPELRATAVPASCTDTDTDTDTAGGLRAGQHAAAPGRAGPPGVAGPRPGGAPGAVGAVPPRPRSRGGSAGPGPALSCAAGRRCLNSGACRAALSFAPLRAHVKKKQNLYLNQESCEREQHPQSPESFQVTLGDAVMVFPPPPPPYFADPMSPTLTHCLTPSVLPTSEDPPPYHSIFTDGAQLGDDERTVAVRDYESVYTISGSSSPSDILPMLYLSSEPPPKYEEQASITNS